MQTINPFEVINSKLEQLSSDVKEMMQQAVKSPAETASNTLVLDINGAAEVLSIPPNSIRYHIKNNMLPFFKPGRSLLFLKEDLLDWLVAFRNGEIEERKLKALKEKYKLK